MSGPCIGEPVSWLRLERFNLDEIAGVERERIAEHLAACAACAGCLAHIQDDDSRALPPLSLSRPARRSVLSLFPMRAAAALGALAAAAAIVGAVRSNKPPGDLARTTTSANRVKGEAFAFSLVRDDDERIVGPEGVYRDGDRFKAVVTCPPGANVVFDVVVYDVVGASFPVEPARALACGNDVPIPGAFRLTGDAEETVCLVWKEGAVVDRGRLMAGVGDEGSRSCKRLRPAPKP